MDANTDGPDTPGGVEVDNASELKRILALAEDGAWGDAAAQLRELLAESPDDATVLAWLGVAELELGLEGVANERFRRALDTEPTDPTLLTTAGAALARVDDPAAEGALRSAALLGPDLLAARLNYGAYLTREGMFDQAMTELTAALTLDAADADVHRELGTLLALMGRSEQAIEAYESAVLTDPADSLSLVLLGFELRAADDTERAAASFAEAARRTPEDLNAQLLAALSSKEMGWEAAASEFLERARMVAGPDELEPILEIDDVLDRDPEDAKELLMDLAATEHRLRRALLP